MLPERLKRMIGAVASDTLHEVETSTSLCFHQYWNQPQESWIIYVQYKCKNNNFFHVLLSALALNFKTSLTYVPSSPLGNKSRSVCTSYSRPVSDPLSLHPICPHWPCWGSVLPTLLLCCPFLVPKPLVLWKTELTERIWTLGVCCRFGSFQRQVPSVFSIPESNMVLPFVLAPKIQTYH